MAYDRDDVLARTDLAVLADELLGSHRGRGRSATWPCPEPNHGPQTGRTPPVSLYVSPRGTERWHCHGCGAGGTAADLVMVVRGVGFTEALEHLAARAGVAGRPGEWEAERDRRLTGRPARPARLAVAREPDPEVEAYVAACEAQLWSPGGTAARKWLAHRGLGDEVLRANRVGSDPGPQRLERVGGLPRGGRAVVFPVLAEDGRAVYLQARYLHPRSHKYDNPSSDLAGPSPRVADIRTPLAGLVEGVVLVTEGIPDALTAAQAGYRCLAVLGAGLPDRRVADEVVRRHPSEQLVVAFDADHRGRAGAAALADLLAERGAGERVGLLEVPGAWGDLNGWLAGAGLAFASELAAAVEHARVPAADRESPDLVQDLASLHYRFVLGASPAEAAANIRQVRVLLERWEADSVAPVEPGTSPELASAVESLCYRHLLADDGPAERARRQLVSHTLDRWEADLGMPTDRELEVPVHLQDPASPAWERELEMDLGR